MIKLSPEIINLIGSHAFDVLMNMPGEVFRQQGDRETVQIALGSTRYFIKRYRQDLFIPGAKTEWEALHTCVSLGVPAPALKGFGAHGRRSFVLMEALDNASTLEHARPAFADKMLIIQQMADIARKLHSNGYFHRDFYLCHFFWNGTDKKVILIDLHRLFKPLFFKRHYLEKDLSSLFFSCFDEGMTRNDVFRFLKRYFRESLKDIFLKHARLLKACEQKAIGLYQKVNLHAPRHIAWLTHHSFWPDTVGPFHHVFEVNGKTFESDHCLRVLPDRRMVLSGMYQGKPAVLKWFAHEREYARDMAGYEKLTSRVHVIPLLDKGQYFYIMPFIDARPLVDLNETFLIALAQLHAARLIQTDPHVGNFLIDAAQKTWFLDPGSIQSVHQDTACWDNLAQCYAQWPSHLDAAHLNLLPVYVHARGEKWSDALRSDFIKRLKKARAYRLKKWLSKIYRNSTEFYAKSRPDGLILAKRAFVNLSTQALMQSPDSYFKDESVFLKQGQSNTVVKYRGAYLRPNDTGANMRPYIVIKRYNLKSPLHFLKNVFRGSKARRAWRNAHLARFMGVKTPEALMVIEKRLCYLPTTSYLVTQFIEGESLFQINFDHVSPPELKAMAEQIAHYLNVLNMSQCYHGDLKGSNWIWNGHDMYLTDLDSFRYIDNPKVFAKYHEADLKRFMFNFDDAHPLKAALNF